MKYTVFIVFLVLFCTPSVFGQKPCADYTCVIAKVKKGIADKNYRFAFEQLESADSYPNKNDKEISGLRGRIFDAIEKQRKFAEEAEKREKEANEDLKRKQRELEIKLNKQKEIFDQFYAFPIKTIIIINSN